MNTNYNECIRKKQYGFCPSQTCFIVWNKIILVGMSKHTPIFIYVYYLYPIDSVLLLNFLSSLNFGAFCQNGPFILVSCEIKFEKYVENFLFSKYRLIRFFFHIHFEIWENFHSSMSRNFSINNNCGILIAERIFFRSIRFSTHSTNYFCFLGRRL